MTDAILSEARRQELDRLFAQFNGSVTPEQVVAFARDPETALHGVFEWDDTEAAARYRVNQAQQYLRVAVRLIERPNEEPVRVRAFVSLPSDRGANGYRRTEDVMADPTRRAEILALAEREFRFYRKRFQHLKELSVVFEAADEAFAGRGSAGRDWLGKA